MALSARHRAGTEERGTGDDRGRDVERPTDLPKAGWKDTASRTMAAVKRDQVPLLSSGVAFWVLLAIAPALVALITTYGLVADPATVEQQVEDAMAGAPGYVQELVQEQLDAAATRSGAAAGLSLLASLGLALWSASAAMKHLMSALNVVYEEEETRGFLKLRGTAVALMVGGVVFISVALLALAVLPALLDRIALGDVGRTAITILRWPAMALLLLGALAVIYRVGPDRDDPRWRWVTPGALVATVLWLAGSALFAVYTSNFGQYDETYGSLAGVVVLMFWLLLFAFVVLLGAEINHELERQTSKDTTVGAPRPRGEREAHGADTVGPTKAELEVQKSREKERAERSRARRDD